MQLRVKLSKKAFIPGERVSCTVQVYNDATSSGQPVQVQDLLFSASGIERTDKQWIRVLHRSDVQPEQAAEPRKLVRTIFKAVAVPLLHDVDVAPGTAHQFHVRFRLPLSIPPSFRGQSCRFAYSAEVRIVYNEKPAGASQSATRELSESVSFTVWPPLPTLGLSLRSPALSHQQQPPPQLSQPLQSGSSVPSVAQTPSGPVSQSQVSDLVPSRTQTATNATGAGTSSSGTVLADTPLAQQAPVPLPRVSISSEAPAARGRPSTDVSRTHSTPFAAQQAALHLMGEQGSLQPPVIDYQLKQQVKVKWKEMPVDYSALRGQRHAVYGSTVALPLESPPRTHSNHTTPSPSLSTRSLASLSNTYHQHHHYDPDRPHRPQHAAQAPQIAASASARSFATAPLVPSVITSPVQMGSGKGERPSTGGEDPLASLERYQASARLAEASKGQLMGRRTSSYIAGSDSSSSWSDSHTHTHTHTPDGGRGTSGGGGGRGWRRQRSGLSTAPSPLQPLQPAGSSVADWAVRSQLPSPFAQAYSLQLREHTVLRVMLQAPLDSPLQPGASFGGLLDLRPNGLNTPLALQCHCLTVLLESEEIVHPDHSARSAGRKAPVPGVMRKLHCEHQEITSDMALSHFMFSVPPLATPSFETPMVSLRWTLRFELTIGPPLPVLGMLTQDKVPAVSAAKFEQLLWSLPITVLTPQGVSVQQQ